MDFLLKMSRRLLEISSIDDPLRPKLETFFNSSGIYFTAEGTQGEGRWQGVAGYMELGRITGK